MSFADYVSGFWAEWFGPEPRELGDPKRWLAETPEDLQEFIASNNPPVFMSVNYYNERNRVSRISDLFFDFDYKDDLSVAWEDARIFARRLESYYDIKSLLCFSGNKGYHLHVFLDTPIGYNLSQRHLKQLYERLQVMLLGRGQYPSLDMHVVGDVKRLARVPYTRHEKSGEYCQPVDVNQRPVLLMPGFKYVLREHGVTHDLVVKAASQIFDGENEKLRPKKVHPKRPKTFDNGLRPCIEAVIQAGNIHTPDHKMKVAAVAEMSAHGWSAERIISAFSSMADFDRKTTETQVRHALKRGYKPFKCSTIQRLGGCVGSECPYYRRRRS